MTADPPVPVGGPSAPPSYRIRPATPDDIGSLREIERAAGDCFRDVGMPQVADDEPLPADVLLAYQLAGRAWVAVDRLDHVVGYVISDPVDGAVHIEQVSVHPDHAHRRIGRSLVDRAADQAAGQVAARHAVAAAVTLTTFRDVPWNAPYYARCGFRTLDEGDWTPGLRAIREREAAHGLDRWPRVCMRRDPRS